MSPALFVEGVLWGFPFFVPGAPRGFLYPESSGHFVSSAGLNWVDHCGILIGC